ncbi:MAG: PAS domain S-box protein [Bacteroidota bacterium]
MEKLTAIAQISILLIVAFLIGFVTAWLYWRMRYRKMKESYESRLSEMERDLATTKAELKKALDENETTLRELKKVEQQMEELSKSKVPEELYQQIVRNVGEGISVSDGDGNFLVYNPRLEEITGYSHTEAIEHKEKLFLEKLYPDKKLRATVAEDIDHVPEGDEYTNIKTTIKCKSGESKPILVSSTMIDYNNKKYYLTAYRDVSEKPKVEHVKS